MNDLLDLTNMLREVRISEISEEISTLNARLEQAYQDISNWTRRIALHGSRTASGDWRQNCGR